MSNKLITMLIMAAGLMLLLDNFFTLIGMGICGIIIINYISKNIKINNYGRHDHVQCNSSSGCSSSFKPRKKMVLGLDGKMHRDRLGEIWDDITIDMNLIDKKRNKPHQLRPEDWCDVWDVKFDKRFIDRKRKH